MSVILNTQSYSRALRQSLHQRFAHQAITPGFHREVGIAQPRDGPAWTTLTPSQTIVRERSSSGPLQWISALTHQLLTKPALPEG